MIRSPRSRVAPIAASFVAVLALGLAACGDDDDADTTTPATDVASTDETAATATAGSDVEVTTPESDSSEVASSTPGSGSASGEVGTEDEYVEAIASVIGFQDAEAGDCVAGALIDAVGYDQITEAGVTVDQFVDEGPVASGLTIDGELDEVSSNVASCGDVLAEATAQMDDARRACVEDNLDNDQLSEFLVAQFFETEPSDEVATNYEAVDTCISELTATSVAS